MGEAVAMRRGLILPRYRGADRPANSSVLPKSAHPHRFHENRGRTPHTAIAVRYTGWSTNQSGR